MIFQGPQEVEPPFFWKESGQGDLLMRLVFWHVIVILVKLWGEYFGIIRLVVYYVSNLHTSVFFHIQTLSCDTMKVAIVFVLLFATVLCRPVSCFLYHIKTTSSYSIFEFCHFFSFVCLTFVFLQMLTYFKSNMQYIFTL